MRGAFGGEARAAGDVTVGEAEHPIFWASPSHATFCPHPPKLTLSSLLSLLPARRPAHKSAHKKTFRQSNAKTPRNAPPVAPLQ